MSFSFCNEATCGCPDTRSDSGSSCGNAIVSFVCLSPTVSVTYTLRRSPKCTLLPRTRPPTWRLRQPLRGCRSLHIGWYYCKEGNIVRRAAAPGYAVGYPVVSGSRGSLEVTAHLRGVYRRTPLVLSQAVFVFQYSALETAPSLGSL